MGKMIKYALFGDGCAAAVLSAQELQPGDGKWIVEGIFFKKLTDSLYYTCCSHYKQRSKSNILRNVS